ncbi:MAG: T9SS type A sorting domain-containing protein [Bacteroidetes bacterium]|nr:T9SS type A sorting domain-containing protein [Bacteroidota bacterium]
MNDADKSNAGTMTITDPDRTQIMTNDLQFQDRQYATYTKTGTGQFSDGLGFWKVKWTAPVSTKNVTLYAATVIANDDDTDYGDYVLTGSLPLSSKSASGVTEHTAQPSWFSAPIIKGNSLTCSYTLEEPSEVFLELSDLSGKVFPFGKRHFEAGTSTVEHQLSGFAAGIYIVRASSSVGVFSHTIILR